MQNVIHNKRDGNCAEFDTKDRIDKKRDKTVGANKKTFVSLRNLFSLTIFSANRPQRQKKNNNNIKKKINTRVDEHFKLLFRVMAVCPISRTKQNKRQEWRSKTTNTRVYTILLLTHETVKNKNKQATRQEGKKKEGEIWGGVDLCLPTFKQNTPQNLFTKKKKNTQKYEKKKNM
ncbi:hypothetical protein RFI_09554 [Reticulomyxa filosa]|uniref:Uncharacterized protein n=1 Tax=Reticulomyxa filosa TaxID=46433 RepID=X6NNR6_RETFI|nr:hypothetical protein RFI_09554 [Reticulomyxa filosa]|eukprot:ETO27578.1 hypothetical protein RFI_09554 [Reticulomyxa filosa]